MFGASCVTPFLFTGTLLPLLLIVMGLECKSDDGDVGKMMMMMIVMMPLKVAVMMTMMMVMMMMMMKTVMRK